MTARAARKAVAPRAARKTVGVRLVLVVSFAARRPWVPRPVQLERWAQAAIRHAAPQRHTPRVGPPAPAHARGGRPGAVRVSIRIVGLARSRRLNARYRGKDRPTNVLSFGGAGALPDGSLDAGELVICAPLVAREAARQGKRPAAHWAHLTVHGVLHLLGLDHERPAEARRMEAREAQILERLGVSNPYAYAGG